jgi:hypothetical protein
MRAAIVLLSSFCVTGAISTAPKLLAPASESPKSPPAALTVAAPADPPEAVPVMPALADPELLRAAGVPALEAPAPAPATPVKADAFKALPLPPAAPLAPAEELAPPRPAVAAPAPAAKPLPPAPVNVEEVIPPAPTAAAAAPTPAIEILVQKPAPNGSAPVAAQAQVPAVPLNPPTPVPDATLPVPVVNPVPTIPATNFPGGWNVNGTTTQGDGYCAQTTDCNCCCECQECAPAPRCRTTIRERICNLRQRVSGLFHRHSSSCCSCDECGECCETPCTCPP